MRAEVRLPQEHLKGSRGSCVLGPGRGQRGCRRDQAEGSTWTPGEREMEQLVDERGGVQSECVEASAAPLEYLVLLGTPCSFCCVAPARVGSALPSSISSASPRDGLRLAAGSTLLLRSLGVLH